MAPSLSMNTAQWKFVQETDLHHFLHLGKWAKALVSVTLWALCMQSMCGVLARVMSTPISWALSLMSTAPKEGGQRPGSAGRTLPCLQIMVWRTGFMGSQMCIWISVLSLPGLNTDEGCWNTVAATGRKPAPAFLMSAWRQGRILPPRGSQLGFPQTRIHLGQKLRGYTPSEGVGNADGN